MIRQRPLLHMLAALPAVVLVLGRLRRLHRTSDMRGLVAAVTPGERARPLSAKQAEVALRLSRAIVVRLPRVFPQPCLYWSLAAYHFLSRAGQTPVIHVGVKSEAGRMLSHAWVTVRGKTVGEQPDPDGFEQLISLP